ncbi:MAG TPA: sulfite exporter TauE/SafE family protein [Bacteroidota bacterium]|nr:sulfite exporter TauE/SafE family protein [Bacteroidota bacterium]
MGDNILLLAGTAATIGVVHTLIGPDHYLPFIMMAKARAWKLPRTLLITFLCGLGHVLGSVLLGLVGVAFGVALHELELIESVRGEYAAWALIAFGVLYALWGLRQALKPEAHAHEHAHDDGVVHAHAHVHLAGRAVHARRHHREMTFWALFTIFVLGPCEPLIPVLMYPAAAASTAGLLLVTGTFAITTIATMLGMVALVSAGLERLPLRALERYTHVIAGSTIALSGLAIQLLGL